MSLAVVEYSSKSGDIWRHTPERPNYLCDPAHVMDPTSFGCYVSALSGEHVPLTKIINTSRFLNRVHRKLHGAWPTNYSLDYFTKFDRLLVVYEAANSRTLSTFIHRLQRELPNLKILGVPTQPYGLLRLQWQIEPQIKLDLQEFINSCDIFISIVKSTTDLWQSFTTHPVHYLPQPYPVEHALRNWQPRSSKQPIIFVSGVTARPNIQLGHEVASALQQQFPDHIIHVTNTPDAPLDSTHLQGLKYEVKPFLSWSDHLRYLSTVKLVINTDFTQTRGRVQMDCAAVGTPSVGADSDAQLDLWPRGAAVADTPVATIVKSASRLLSDSHVYEEWVKFARSRLPFYNYAHSADRMNSLYSLIKK